MSHAQLPRIGPRSRKALPLIPRVRSPIWVPSPDQQSPIATDPYFGNVVVLIPLAGANNGTTLTDYSSKERAVTRYGDLKTSTAQSVYYGSSGLFDGNGDYFTLADSADWDFGTGDYTLEFWIKPAVNNATQTLISSYTSWAADLWMYFCISSAGKLWYRCGGNVAINITGTTTVSTSAWSHVAVCRASGTTRLFLNGGIEGSSNTSTSLTCPSTVGVGYELYGGAGFYNGYMSDFRITAGAARYAAAFTVPDRMCGTLTEQSMGIPLIVDESGNPAARTVCLIPRAAPKAARTLTSSAGRFSTWAPRTEHDILLLDDDASGRFNDRLYPRIMPS